MDRRDVEAGAHPDDQSNGAGQGRGACQDRTLDQVDSIDSSGLGAIVAVMKVLGSDRKLELSNLSAKVRTVFRLTRMDAVMTIHDAVETALADASPAS